jgi:hypothetical protein
VVLGASTAAASPSTTSVLREDFFFAWDFFVVWEV